MNTDQLIKKIEMNFESLTGLSIHGLLGIIIGLIIFYLFLFLINYERKKNRNFDFQTDSLSDVGDPIEVNLNLVRSFIEMKEIEKAEDHLSKVELVNNLTEAQIEKIKFLKGKIKENKDV